MKRVLLCAFAVAIAALGLACSLNPQPFPPDNPDSATAGLDAAKGGNDATAFGDAGATPDGGEDASPLPGTDSGVDAGADAESDGGNDAESDASDAADASDATSD